MTAMEMKRWAEACEKERRTWLRPAATAQDTTAADTARTLAHTAKLERASAIHLWHVERGYAPTAARNPGQLSNVTSAMGELALGTSTATSQFLVPPPRRPTRKVVALQSPTVYTSQLVRGVDAGALDERAYQRFASQMDYSRLTDASDVPLPPAPARGPARLSGATLEAAEGYLAGRRALSGWELGPRGESAAQFAVDREQARARDAQETLGELLKMTGRRSRPKRRPEDNEPVPGARPRHPLQNSVGTLRHGVPRESRAPEDAEYTPPRHGVDAVLDPQRKITPPGVSSAREFMGAPRLGKMVAK